MITFGAEATTFGIRTLGSSSKAAAKVRWLSASAL
jgi:hypothetical protein